ncbi:hypothetical protein DEU56DRAFT_755423 [Suillus clintonianus]|uniref:uncharacterized protein n=1 Tax=Suillus clintonianus TaxID=1904413 RepID=UPI001B87D2CE|nr:uncharacterized protein DEU56DRAFT_755423 [Suillus clintonianus]KAG2139647.1 hypothetical protein DEU56DRAFT_755423 [Suillus clintonianus]
MPGSHDFTFVAWLFCFVFLKVECWNLPLAVVLEREGSQEYLNQGWLSPLTTPTLPTTTAPNLTMDDTTTHAIAETHFTMGNYVILSMPTHADDISNLSALQDLIPHVKSLPTTM